MKICQTVILLSLASSVACAPGSQRSHPQQDLGNNSDITGNTTETLSTMSYFTTSHSLSLYDNSTTATRRVALSTPKPLLTRQHLMRRGPLFGSPHRHFLQDRRHAYLRMKASTGSSVVPGYRGTRTSVNSATKARVDKREPRPQDTQGINLSPTPAPTSAGSSLTTVHINDTDDFALLLPKNPNEPIGDSETDAVSFCTASGCSNTIPGEFIAAAAVTRAPDNTSWIQVTGCINPDKFPLSSSDDGGQFDVRYPDGAQCTFGGYGASFIEQVEPSAKRFCMRCCANANDQENCNSHQDRAGCVVAIPGVYDFPELGVSCS